MVRISLPFNMILVATLLLRREILISDLFLPALDALDIRRPLISLRMLLVLVMLFLVREFTRRVLVRDS